MINLFDRYTSQSKDLHISMLLAGFKQPAVAIQDSGFLPNDVDSALKFFFKKAGAKLVGKPKYFNQIPIPHYWSFDATGNEAKIMDGDIQRGHITYTASDNTRLVKQVEWFDKQGRTRIIENYNQWGWMFKQVILDIAGNWRMTNYLTADGDKILVENNATGNVTYFAPNKKYYTFKNWVDLMAYYLKHSNLNTDRIMFNSLAAPFFTLLEMPDTKGNLLFWQEPIHDEIPGNMMFILEGNAGDTKVVVQNKDDYLKIISLLDDEKLKQKVKYLGYIYPFVRLNKVRKHALIFTNSDQIEGLEDLIKQLPDFEFSIAAGTEMSDKLLAMDKYDNTKLYPSVAPQRIKKLVADNDLYLDINYGNEIYDAVRGAFENNMLIVGFNDTLHNKRYVAPENRFGKGHVDIMVAAIKQAFDDPNKLEKRLQLQKRYAGLETAESYQKVIDKWGK